MSHTMPQESTVGQVSCRHGVVTWKVQNFTSLSELENSGYNSPCFRFQDRLWRLELHPNCKRFSSSNGHVTLFIVLVDSWAPIELRCSLGIQAADGKTQVWEKDTKTFRRCWHDRMRALGSLRLELLHRKEELLPQDVLTVTATMQETGADEEGTKEVSVQTEDNAENDGEVEVVQEKLGGVKGVLQDIKMLWVSGENSDVVLKVKNVEFKAHRIILTSRTPALGAMFQHDTAEKASGEVTIDDCEPAVFEQLLHYIYTGAPRVLNAENAVSLYVVADKYLVSEVKALCVRCMKEELCLDTFCDYTELSLMYNERELLEKAADFLSRNTIPVMKTVEWQRFLSEHSTWANEILIRAAELTEARNGKNRN